ncbi:carbamoyl-phosphate synthase domain-containing protein [Chloroflexota bacterium]
MTKRAVLVLEDGSVYEGYAFGSESDVFGEVVFNTSMTGYQEMLTDPSYAGQIVVPTYPLIGNYGVNEQDFESARIQVSGFAVREECLEPNHYLATGTIYQYLTSGNIPGISGVDTYLGPEMKSTGEIMGIDYTFDAALAKAPLAAGLMLMPQGAILFSIADRGKPEALPIIRKFHKVGYTLYATEGTAAMIEAAGLPVKLISKKLSEGHPNVVDIINDGIVNGVVNTITGGRIPLRDGFEIRRAAAEKRVPCFTSLDTARTAMEILLNSRQVYSAQPLPDYRTKEPS